jgi:hypothetical protein
MKKQLSVVVFAKLETVKRNGKEYIVNPYTHELRPVEKDKRFRLWVCPEISTHLKLQNNK